MKYLKKKQKFLVMIFFTLACVLRIVATAVATFYADHGFREVALSKLLFFLAMSFSINFFLFPSLQDQNSRFKVKYSTIVIILNVLASVYTLYEILRILM